MTTTELPVCESCAPTVRNLRADYSGLGNQVHRLATQVADLRAEMDARRVDIGPRETAGTNAHLDPYASAIFTDMVNDGGQWGADDYDRLGDSSKAYYRRAAWSVLNLQQGGTR